MKRIIESPLSVSTCESASFPPPSVPLNFENAEGADDAFNLSAITGNIGAYANGDLPQEFEWSTHAGRTRRTLRGFLIVTRLHLEQACMGPDPISNPFARADLTS